MADDGNNASSAGRTSTSSSRGRGGGRGRARGGRNNDGRIHTESSSAGNEINDNNNTTTARQPSGRGRGRSDTSGRSTRGGDRGRSDGRIQSDIARGGEGRTDSGRGRSGRNRGRSDSGRGGRGRQGGGRGATDTNDADTHHSDITVAVKNLRIESNPPQQVHDQEDANGKPGNNTRNTNLERGGRGRGRGNHTKTAKSENTEQKKDGNNEKVDNGGKSQNKGDAGKPTTGKKKDLVKSDNETRTKNTMKNIAHSVSHQSTSTIPANQPQQTSDINYGKGGTIHVVHIAEKPSIGQAIAKGLAEGHVNSYSKALPVSEFTGPGFPKAPYAANCNHTVTSVAGHVFSVDFPSQYQSWDSVDPAELFTAPIQRKADKGSVVKHLQESARGADFIVLWMDCDREGENINFEVLECCMHLMKPGGSNFDRVYRAYFSAINPSDIKKAYNALGKPDKNQSMSVDARQELDLKVGVAFSRFQTKFFQGRYGDLESGVLSYGPCQTPTLGFCVQRHIDIETFKPEKFWVLDLGIMKRGRAVRALWNSGRSFDRAKVQKLQEEAFMNSAVVEVKNITSKQTKQARPIPLNTVALLKACSKALSLGPHAAMQTAERLYLMGYLSYPRTESTTYPKSFDIRGTLQQQASDARWGSFARNLVQEGHNSSRGGVDMGDHPPITPCRAARSGELTGDMDRVFDLVVRHFIASVSPDAIWQSTRVDFVIDALGEKGHFTLRGKTLVSPGFLAVMLHKQYSDAPADDDEEEEEERTIPEFEIGEVMALANSTNTTSGKLNVISNVAVRATLDIREGVTSPPGYLTESELIGLMEKHGIGTDASIPTHIENIQKRNYVALGSGRRLLPQKLGLVLVQGYHLIDSSLVLPQVRSDIEGQCGKIAKGLATKEAVVSKAITLFASKYDFFIKNIDKMDLLFGASFSKLEDIGKPFTRCGLSRRYLQFIPGPPPRLYNKWTETVYPLPIGGVVKQWSGRECPVDGCHFELCLYLVGQPERTFPFCPRCYNDIEWALHTDDTMHGVAQEDVEDKVKERQLQRVAGKAIVLECPLPDHHPVVEELTVSPDPEGDGVLIVDPHFGPKWRLNATRDPTIHYLPRLSIDKLSILNKKDETHDTRLMQIIFKADKTPLPGGETKLVTNFIDDTVLRGMVVVHHGQERSKPTFRRGGRVGRGRGRGRGGSRGGGRGRYNIT